MIPLVGFVALDLWCKATGRQTTSRLLREHPLIALGVISWGIWHLYIEDWSY